MEFTPDYSLSCIFVVKADIQLFQIPKRSELGINLKKLMLVVVHRHEAVKLVIEMRLYRISNLGSVLQDEPLIILDNVVFL